MGFALISIVVVIVISLLVLGGVLVRGRQVAIATVPVERGGNGLRWLWIGVGVSSIPLIVALVWTISVLAAVSGPPGKPKVLIEVTGAQWWWKARYLDPDPSRVFTTANEIHIPTGQPVQIRLVSADVIHSFWVPALTRQDRYHSGPDECDLAAGRHARHLSRPVHRILRRAACAYGLPGVAQSPAEFRLWQEAQIKPAPPPSSAKVASGERNVRVPLRRLPHGPRQQSRWQRRS